jgi:hypothetical protein
LPAPSIQPEDLNSGLGSTNFKEPGKDRAMKNETAREMVLQTMVALLSMGLAVLSVMFMGRWV